MTFSELKIQGGRSFQRLFSIDTRSLALARIGAGTLLLIDLFFRVGEIGMFYVTSGVSPRTGFFFSTWSWSLHTLFDNEWWVLGLFFIHGIAALALIFGVKTRLASIVAFVLVVSLHHANLTITYGADAVLRLVLFGGMFLPWGTVYSYDARKKGKFSQNYTLYSPWTAAVVIQFALIYVFAVLHKSGPEWADGTAVYYAATATRFATQWFSGVMTAAPQLSPIFVALVFWTQIIAPLLLFVPVFVPWLRMAAILTLLSMHIAFGVTLHIGWFSYAIAVALVFLIPSEAWDALSRFLHRRGVRAPVSEEVLRGNAVELRKEHEHGLNSVKIFAVVYLSLIVAWNLDNVVVTRIQNDTSFKHNESFRQFMLAVGIDQHWSLFSPRPPTSQIWPVVQVSYRDGRNVDALREYAAVDWSKPEDPHVLFKNLRHAYFLTAMQGGRLAESLPNIAAGYYCKEAFRQTGKQPVKVEIFSVRGPRYYSHPSQGPFTPTRVATRRCASE